MGREIPDDEEPVPCASCDVIPKLFYRPTADEPYRLRCDCEITTAGVTSALNETKLIDRTGKWSNFDYDSTLRYDET